MVSLRVDVCEELPALAWVGEVSGSGARALVGPAIEVFEGGFLEGAWDGDWGAKGVLESEAVCATGLVSIGERLACVVSTHPEEYVFEVRTERGVLLSNSHVLLLAIMEDRFAAGVEDPITALVRAHHRGFVPVALPTEKGNAVIVHSYGHLDVGADGRVTRSLPRRPAAPRDFAQVHALLRRHMRGVMENALDGRRARQLGPVVALSAGYDSVAVGAIAAELGVRSCVGLVGDGEDPSRIALCLGMEGPVLAAEGFRELGGFPEARFAASFGGINAPLAVFEEELRGRLVLTGFGGDEVWDAERWIYAGQRMPLDRVCSHLGQEFRLGAGFAQIALPWQLLSVARAVHRVTRSAEMDPWRVGGGYDRPIARRLGEEAGVARELFGVAKARAGAEPVLGRRETMSAASFVDFERFRGEFRGWYQLPGGMRRRLGAAQLLLAKALRGLPSPLDEAVAITGSLPFGASARMGAKACIAEALAWGIERVRPTYEVAAERFRSA